MKPATYLTTSWDDGHPLDLRVAELLAKYKLRGTFYIPRRVEHGTLTTAQLRDLSGHFEVGAHTLDHVVLTTVSDEQARREIVDSKAWLEDASGSACSMFCPPRGRYARRHLHFIRRAGFLGVRTTEPFSLDLPTPRAGVLVLPTTVQAYKHSVFDFTKYALRWTAGRNLWNYVMHGRSIDWVKLVQSYLSRALRRGGVFHLWGHSWELERYGQWQRLEEILCLMGQFSDQATALTNGEICEASPVCARMTAGATGGNNRQECGGLVAP